MKLRTTHNGFEWTCVDDDSYQGGGLIGTGPTEAAAKEDFREQLVAEQVDQDIANGVPALKSWDAMVAKMVGVKS